VISTGYTKETLFHEVNNHRENQRKVSPRVCVFTHNPIIGGGVYTMMTFIGRYLIDKGYQPTYFFPAQNFKHALVPKKLQLSSLSRIDAFQVWSVPYIIFLNSLIPAFATKRMLHKYDIYQGVGGGNVCCLPFVINRKPFVCWVATTMRDEWPSRFNPLKFTFSPKTFVYYINHLFMPLVLIQEKKIYEKASKILALSSYTAQSIQKQYGIPAEKILVVHFPIDTDKFKPSKSGERIMDGDFLLMVGRITDPRKNVELLLKSFAIIKTKFPNLNLVIIGDKPQSNNLEKFCTKLGIRDSVHFLGRMNREEIITYYNQAKLFILPSLQEGLGIIVLESMACGTPVVSTKCGGPEEIIIDGENGYLVENNNLDELTHAVCKLLEDDELRKRMGEKAREHIQNNYSLQKVGYKFIAAYKEVYPHLFG